MRCDIWLIVVWFMSLANTIAIIYLLSEQGKNLERDLVQLKDTKKIYEIMLTVVKAIDSRFKKMSTPPKEGGGKNEK
jgi:hypothetical protein